MPRIETSLSVGEKPNPWPVWARWFAAAMRLAHRGRASLELQFTSPAVGTPAFLAGCERQGRLPSCLG